MIYGSKQPEPEGWTGLSFADVQDVGALTAEVSKDKVTPRFKLLFSRVTVQLHSEERREVVLPRPLKACHQG